MGVKEKMFYLDKAIVIQINETASNSTRFHWFSRNVSFIIARKMGLANKVAAVGSVDGIFYTYDGARL